MNSLIEILHNYFLVGAGSLFLLQAIILFLRGKNNAARQTMAMMDLVWGSGYIIVIILLNSIGKTDEFLPFRARYVVVGGVYISLMMLYLMQVLIPGWLNWKRLLLVESPVVLFILTFYGVTMLLGQTVEEISTYSMLWDSIGHFNVWFRFVLLIAEIVYLTFMLKWLHGYEIKYIQWKNDNYANSDSMDISWIHTYYFIIMGITVFYLIVFLIGGRVTILCHTIFATASFSYLFYKTLFYENPYPIGFFDSLDEKKQQQKLDEMYVPICSDASETEQKVNEETFENKIPEYVEKIKVWMDEEKPYLYHDFKLTDVSRILPLNRSYLSRVFNEGFGHSFSEAVRLYRVNYSKEILKSNHSIPMGKVAEMSGFNSDSSFIRSFKQVTGSTPSQYRTQI